MILSNEKMSVSGHVFEGNVGKQNSILDEQVLNYARPGKNGECELIIGLDFGTSASKVVIHAPEQPGSPAYAVNFGEFAHPSMVYLLPSRLQITQAGICTLGNQDGASLVNDIKLELFSHDENLKSNRGPMKQGLSPEATATAYLSLLLRYARRWFLTEKRDLVGDFERLNWSVNLGVPSPCIEDNEENRRFRRVGMAAWMLSVLHEGVTIEKAQKELKLLSEAPEYWEQDEDGLTCDFDIIPEIAAGAVGYALSQYRRYGVHVMIDIGASTVDVCGFVLHQPDGESKYSLLTAAVEPLGTIKLHNQRIDSIQKAYDVHARDLREKHDPLTPISDGIEPYLLSDEDIRSEVKNGENSLKKDCLRMVRKIIHDLKVRRTPLENAWRGELPILLIGGGSKLPFFQSLKDDLNDWLIRFSDGCHANFLPIPVPPTLPRDTQEYHRLAVAWGLSHRKPDVGEIVPADSIPDIDPLGRRDWESAYISKDQV